MSYEIPQLNWQVSRYYNDLPANAYFAEYIWIGGSGSDLRSKTKTLYTIPKSLKDFPIWNFDGSSTNQAKENNSEVFLIPVAYYPDPFRVGEGNFLVQCECRKSDYKTPIESNTRYEANKIMELAKDDEPTFGLEQEYIQQNDDGKTILGWCKDGKKQREQGPFYCSIGAENAFGRQVVNAHLRACSYAKQKIAGINGETCPGQWEYQIGPCVGIDVSDQIWISRYILQRVCEDFRILCTFEPKLLKDRPGSGCHTNYSTKKTRNKENGYQCIIDMVEKLKKKHSIHIKQYGKNNENRLTGKNETAEYNSFSYGVSDRHASIRIPTDTVTNNCGYFEDRRPGGNCDPYVVTSIIVKATILDENDEGGSDDTTTTTNNNSK